MRVKALFLTLTFIGVGAYGAMAQRIPVLRAVSPVGAQRGTDVEVTLTGDGLDGLTGIVFSGPGGITAEIAPAPRQAVNLTFSGGGIRRETGEGKRTRAVFKIAADAPLGEREVRARGPEGVSAPIKFIVGSLKEVRERGANNRREDAQPIEMPATINGRVGAAAEEDFYKFTATKGQRLIFDLLAFRIGSPLDSTLTLYNDKGEQVARNEDANGLDSLLDYTAPETGDYILGVRDLRYQGGGNYTYRLSVGEIPYLDAIYPLGGQRGATVDVKFSGRNLGDMGGAKLAIAPDAGTGPQEIRAETAAGASNARSFEVSAVPGLLEAEPNDKREQAATFGAPFNIDGRIDKEKDTDIYKFAAQPGQRIAFQVRARRYGSPLDSVITVTNAEGGVIAANDDYAGGQADSTIDFAGWPAAGDYYLTITDVQGRGGEDYIYRIAVFTPQTDFTGRFFPEAPSLGRGGNVNLRVEVERDPGYFNATEIRAEGLPAGVTAKPVLCPADGAPAVWLTLSAAPDAELGLFPFRVVMTGIVAGEKVRRDARPVVRGDKPSDDQFTREAFLTVREASPITLEPITLAAYAYQGAAGGVEGIVRRKAGYSGEVEVTLEGYSTGREPISRSLGFGPVKVPAGQERFGVNFGAVANAETGTRQVMLSAKAMINGQTYTEQSGTFPLTIYEIPFMLSNTLTRLSVAALPPGTESAAGEAVFTIKAERRGLFTGPITLTLEGLPEGVIAEGGVIPEGAEELVLKLSANDKAPGDKPIPFTVLGSSEVAGRRYEHRAPPITLTVAKPEPTPTPAPSATEGAAAAAAPAPAAK